MWIPFLHRIRWVVYTVAAVCLVGGIIAGIQTPENVGAWVIAGAGILGFLTQLAIRHEVRQPGRDPRNTLG
ncbi:hypothetical protein D9V32_11565 [Mycetocola tolaasinivorans]|uniref:Uncharacterized protein n=1 Tax=Mycetocola tolaasinivorans TaxID=76635 RepID=A0A3L7A5C5_9MICO|nr:hypothetical protein [Mycetocola tolaasinivorans]RLP75050.1 hypothetical protein D9V32_11565 [Mycetocola tolaasinivorans]